MPENRPAAPVDWRAAFAPLADAVPQSHTPVALGFELVEVVARTWFEPKHSNLLAKNEVTPGADPSLAIRPLVLSDSGNWVKKSLTWRNIDRMARQFGADPRHQEWFSQLAGLRTRDKTDFTPDGAPYNLGDFHTPLLWQMFTQGRELGVEFVGVNQGMSIHIGRQSNAVIDVNRVQGHLRVQPRATIDERDYMPGLIKPIWTHGFFGVDIRSGFTVTLAPAAEPTTESALSVFDSPGPITIPVDEAEEFFEEYYPQLRTSAEVVSTDDTVKFPQFNQPRLVLFMAFGAKDILSLQWYWEYSGPRRTLPVVPLSKLGTSAIRSTAAGRSTATTPMPSPRDNRDLEHEARVLAQVESILADTQPPGHPRDMELTDADTADFVVNVLPGLEEIEHVKVITRGKKQPYRELGGEPNITITSVESEKNDWFDLGFQITIDGKPIPFVKLYKALAAGTKKIKLVDNTFLSLNKPAFDKLKALLAEADLIPEWEPESPKITRLHVGLWSEFEELADETLPAPSWQESAQALLDLDHLPATQVPHLGGVTMRPYQVQGFRWLALLYRCHLGGILADDMGLGKTLQTLALIVHAQAELPFLVVAPTSVVDNWAKEAAKFTPDLDVRVVSESTQKRKTALAEVVAGADVIIMSYAMLRLDEDPISRLKWAGFVLDEAQFVKNSSSQVHQAAKSVNAPFRLALTGTPMENSLRDVWSLFAITAPGLFPSAHRFEKEYVRPIEVGEDPGRLKGLQKRIRPLMLRRNKDLVAADLPEKQEQVINVELNAAHRKLYDRVLQKERKKILGFIDSEYDKQRFIVFRSLTLLRMLALDPRIVDGEHEGVPSSKLAALMERLEDVVAEGHRSIVFSQFTSFLTKIAEDLDHRGIPYVVLDGSTRNRGRIVEEFRTGAAPVFLISLKAGGFGLNLTEADYVFLMDPWWNPATENQAIDRAHRIGQTKNVMVYRYVAEGTIEEKVLALQKKKAELFDSLMTDGGASDGRSPNGQAFSQTVTAEDIRELLEG
ncbi:Superfamily II DNA or RNA helicase, SNF2 family [Brevibacterium sp. 239c]|uniref:DEAD/DEAH box helicase n=1 Tax=Brevibacterium sp. 239c TaxID=1965356 RepID=UPI000C5AE041|nr:DEAD/DEAH box helicase [Brevibacterium sp. 239c]SMX95159.1 Superfamily II DNA or RNA helicase, SNF2 family [Brevibacterium sp. 239c]